MSGIASSSQNLFHKVGMTQAWVLIVQNHANTIDRKIKFESAVYFTFTVFVVQLVPAEVNTENESKDLLKMNSAKTA